MALDILTKIVEARKADIEKRGIAFGYDIPQERKRRVHPFIQEKGVVLEVKRASPSKGDIAPNLDAAATALAYQEAGASAISVLTEENYFKGNLGDLKRVCDSVDVAVLRKDFLIYPEEIDVAYKIGADAVLLIARILDKEALGKMLSRCASLGITAFVELRLEDDLQKLAAARACDKEAGRATVVCGVNARDLKDFSIDLLTPCGFLAQIKSVMGQDCSVIFESGIRTPQAAAFAGSLGFTGLLLGEAAARDTSQAKSLVENFVGAGQTQNAARWNDFAKKVRARKNSRREALQDKNCAAANGGKTESGTQVLGLQTVRPFVKICGITNMDDAKTAADLGADLLGFVLCAASPRSANEDFIRQARAALRGQNDEKSAPLFVGVVTELSSPEGKAALRLAKEGLLDYIQLHGQTAADDFFADKENLCIPHYCAANLVEESDLQKVKKLCDLGEPRVLVDAKVGSQVGGTGTQVAEELVREAAKKVPLWLAGGLGADNVREAIEKYSPELIDASSLLEAVPGKKDLEKLKKFFGEL